MPPFAADGQRHNLSDQVGTAHARVFIVINTFVGKYSYLKGFVRIAYSMRDMERKNWSQVAEMNQNFYKE